MPRPHALGLILAAVAAVLAGPARAQLSFSLSADTDYRVRGVSLSDGKPDLALSVNYDHDSGAYGGASLLADEGLNGDPRALGGLVYAGLSRRFTDGLAWDVGGELAQLSDQVDLRLPVPASTGYQPGDADLAEPRWRTQTAYYRPRYAEVYAGLISDLGSARLYYSPDYLNEHIGAAYLDLNTSVRPAPRWRLFAHAGALTPVSGSAQFGYRRERYDLRLGSALEFQGYELRLAWSLERPDSAYPLGTPQKSNVFIFGASYFF